MRWWRLYQAASRGRLQLHLLLRHGLRDRLGVASRGLLHRCCSYGGLLLDRPRLELCSLTKRRLLLRSLLRRNPCSVGHRRLGSLHPFDSRLLLHHHQLRGRDHLLFNRLHTRRGSLLLRHHELLDLALPAQVVFTLGHGALALAYLNRPLSGHARGD